MTTRGIKYTNRSIRSILLFQISREIPCELLQTKIWCVAHKEKDKEQQHKAAVTHKLFDKMYQPTAAWGSQVKYDTSACMKAHAEAYGPKWWKLKIQWTLKSTFVVRGPNWNPIRSY